MHVKITTSIPFDIFRFSLCTSCLDLCLSNRNVGQNDKGIGHSEGGTSARNGSTERALRSFGDSSDLRMMLDQNSILRTILPSDTLPRSLRPFRLETGENMTRPYRQEEVQRMREHPYPLFPYRLRGLEGAPGDLWPPMDVDAVTCPAGFAHN